jgi:hypothetical protein
MTHARKSRRSTKFKSRGQGANVPSDPRASRKQKSYIVSLRHQFDPLSAGSELPSTKERASAEIARLLNLKSRYEAGTRAPGGEPPKAAGQYRYPSFNAEVQRTVPDA